MAVRPPLWVYKCNSKSHGQIATGDWNEFFAGPQPGGWGGSDCMGSPRSLDIVWNRMQPDDLVLCWQTDHQIAVGLCRIDSLYDWVDDAGEKQRRIFLEMLGEPFSPPVPILQMRKHDRALSAVRCFQQGLVQTLYETDDAEATKLLRACGISPLALTKLRRSPSTGANPHGGAGFGSPAENRKVEQAAVKKLRKSYKAWNLIDRQKDKIGYDFQAFRGSQERHIELKGARGPMPSFPITKHEVTMADIDPLWRLAVVTDALSAHPQLREWTASAFQEEFKLCPLSFMATLT